MTVQKNSLQKGEGRLTDEILREKIRLSRGPIWGSNPQPPMPKTARRPGSR